MSVEWMADCWVGLKAVESADKKEATSAERTAESTVVMMVAVKVGRWAHSTVDKMAAQKAAKKVG